MGSDGAPQGRGLQRLAFGADREHHPAQGDVPLENKCEACLLVGCGYAKVHCAGDIGGAIPGVGTPRQATSTTKNRDTPPPPPSPPPPPLTCIGPHCRRGKRDWCPEYRRSLARACSGQWRRSRRSRRWWQSSSSQNGLAPWTRQRPSDPPPPYASIQQLEERASAPAEDFQTGSDSHFAHGLAGCAAPRPSWCCFFPPNKTIPEHAFGGIAYPCANSADSQRKYSARATASRMWHALVFRLGLQLRPGPRRDGQPSHRTSCHPTRPRSSLP